MERMFSFHHFFCRCLHANKWRCHWNRTNSCRQLVTQLITKCIHQRFGHRTNSCWKGFIVVMHNKFWFVTGTIGCSSKHCHFVVFAFGYFGYYVLCQGGKLNPANNCPASNRLVMNCLLDQLAVAYSAIVLTPGTFWRRYVLTQWMIVIASNVAALSVAIQ